MQLSTRRQFQIMVQCISRWPSNCAETGHLNKRLFAITSVFFISNQIILFARRGLCWQKAIISLSYFQKLLDDAKDGVILFSFGSNLRSSDMPEATTKAFLEAFSKMKQTVLWKWETNDLEGKPKNVKTAKWLPQSDIMAHENVRLFITHGGLLSMTEAVHHGVPVIAVPFFGDQHFNVRQAERLGYALRLDFNNITVNSLSWALTEVISNPRYRTRAREVCRLFHDRPRAPLEEAVWWTEYVARHRGATALRSAGLDLAWYQLLLLDVAAAALAAVCLLLLAATAAFKAVFANCMVKDVKKNQ